MIQKGTVTPLPLTQPSPSLRLAAKGIDMALSVIIAIALPWFLGILGGVGYLLVADGVRYGEFSGQSVGKKLMGLQALNRIRLQPADYRDSMIRNSPIAIAMFFAMIPIWGWILFVIVGLPLLLIETFLVFRNESHQRLGDVMADTETRFAPDLPEDQVS